MNAQRGRAHIARGILNTLRLEVEAQRDKHIEEQFVSTLIQDVDELPNLLSAPSTSSLSLLLASLHSVLSQLLRFLLQI